MIPRWSRLLGVGGPSPNREGMVRDDEGRWVLHEDHLVEMILNEQRIIPNAWNAGWQQGAIDGARESFKVVRDGARADVVAAVMEYYKVAPKAAEPILRVINEALDTPPSET